jgi:hypothetical protein
LNYFLDAAGSRTKICSFAPKICSLEPSGVAYGLTAPTPTTKRPERKDELEWGVNVAAVPSTAVAATPSAVSYCCGGSLFLCRKGSTVH